MITKLLTRVRARVRARFHTPPRTLAVFIMGILGFRGSLIEVTDQISGVVWSGRAVRVVNENPKTTAESMVGFLFVDAGSPSLSIGSVVSFKSRRFVVQGSGSIVGVTVRELT